MKIAINLTREYVGGITSSNINLISYLSGLDDEFVGIELNSRMYTKGPALFRSFAPEIFDHHIVNIHDIPIHELVKKAKTLKHIEKAYKGAIKTVQAIFRDTKPDVVLLSGTYHAPWLISIAARREKIPIVLWYSGIYSLETKHTPKTPRKLYAAIERSIVRSATQIIFPSYVCETVVEREVIGASLKNSYVIPNPISSIFTDPNAIEHSLERRIAAVGRYSKIKNFEMFFALHKELLRRKWRHTASFVTNALGHRMATGEIPKSIKVLPPMTPEGLKKFYLTQGIIICPSRFETFGNVPMEAACLGIPVLVNENVGCAEILKQVGLGNMVMPFDDMRAVADRIQQLCGQHILPKQLNALKRILDYRFVGDEIRAVLGVAVNK